LTKLLLTPLLNQSQQNALSNRLFLNKECIGGVWGPPGTGKTFVAAIEAANALMERDQRILICAYQNSTVDNTLRCIVKQLKYCGWNDESIRRTISRTGNLSRIADDIKPYFSRNSNDLAQAKIVGTTLHSSFSPLQPELLNVATSRQLKKLVIVGDTMETFSEGCMTSKRIYDFIVKHGTIVNIA
jgi:superfamily I DNA and/or RNA helicase